MLDPNSGDVLTLVSLPAYDPNAFASGIDRATWQALNTDELRPLQNRTIQGRYSPGSTFKIVVATAALEEGVMTPDTKVFCPGGANFYGRLFKCHLAGGHGWVDMRHALEKSCNVYFYTVGNLLGVDRIHEWAERLGLAGKTGIDLPNEVESIIPSTAWKQQRYRRAVVRRRDHLGGDRPGPGVGDADVDGGDDGLGGQRRAGGAAAGHGHRRRRGWLGADRSDPSARGGHARSRRPCRRCTTACGWR